MGKFLRFAVVAVVMVIGASSLQHVNAWGEDGHTWINQVAAEKLPKSMPEFMRKAVDRLGYLGPEPDRWRNQNSEPELKFSQEADHFIDMERIPADFGEFPTGRYGYMKKLYEKRAALLAAGTPQKEADELLPDRVGLQPYITMEVFERMKVAMREYRHALANKDKKKAQGIENNIILYAGWLGHYVADGSQPLHTSVKYDGWVGENPSGYVTKHGIHSDFETRFVRENVQKKDFAGLVHEPVELKNPRQDYIAYLKESNSLVEPLYKIEKAGGFAAKGTPEGREFVNKRLAAGAQMLSNLWYTAWVESAVEPPDPYAEKKAAAAAATPKK
ncbi:MAG: nuclease [Acidobacteriales bacterium]|nr:nuclease [Terriglobales bacterium]